MTITSTVICRPVVALPSISPCRVPLNTIRFVTYQVAEDVVFGDLIFDRLAEIRKRALEHCDELPVLFSFPARFPRRVYAPT